MVLLILTATVDRSGPWVVVQICKIISQIGIRLVNEAVLCFPPAQLPTKGQLPQINSQPAEKYGAM